MLSVSNPWYNYLKDGTKTLEGRLWTPNERKFAKDYLNKVITITCDNNPNDHFQAILTDYYLYDSFYHAVSYHPTLLPGITSISDRVNIYRNFFPEVDEQLYGVVVFVLRKI